MLRVICNIFITYFYSLTLNSLLVTCHSLLTTCYSLLVTLYSLLVTRHSLLVTHSNNTYPAFRDQTPRLPT